ncbi:recombinase [Nocardia sp. FBN12]|uniref:recombinase n=1 Tax=Nocardia sp. FBN12 TaxID=3419766 RepID=UPI003D0348F1
MTWQIAARYRYDWARFTDWARSRGETFLPAGPLVILDYLISHPAADSTQRGRLAAINHAHTTFGYPPPGRAAALRDALTAARYDRTATLRARVQEVLPLPEWGWPEGLFGRRDAAMLVLAAAGLPYKTIAELRLSDLESHPDQVIIGSVPLAVLHATDNEDSCPVAVLHRWTAAVPLLVQAPATMAAARDWLTTGARQPSTLDSTQLAVPLLVSIDRDGRPPLPMTHMAATSVRSIVRNHLSGQVRSHRSRIPDRGDARPGRSELSLVPDSPLPDVHDRGVQARKNAVTLFDDLDLDNVYDEVSRRYDEILNRLHWT